MSGVGDAQPEKQTGRLEAFSDGVFAIAITLLVLEIKAPHPGGLPGHVTGALIEHTKPGAQLLRARDQLLFGAHHVGARDTVSRLTRRSDTRLLFANGLLLLFVSVVPFPTAVLAEYSTTPAAPAAHALYAGFFPGIGVAFLLVMLAAFRESFLDASASASTVRRLRITYRMGPPLYLVATGRGAVQAVAGDGDLHGFVDFLGRQDAGMPISVLH